MMKSRCFLAQNLSFDILLCIYIQRRDDEPFIIVFLSPFHVNRLFPHISQSCAYVTPFCHFLPSFLHARPQNAAARTGSVGRVRPRDDHSNPLLHRPVHARPDAGDEDLSGVGEGGVLATRDAHSLLRPGLHRHDLREAAHGGLHDDSHMGLLFGRHVAVDGASVQQPSNLVRPRRDLGRIKAQLEHRAVPLPAVQEHEYLGRNPGRGAVLQRDGCGSGRSSGPCFSSSARRRCARGER